MAKLSSLIGVGIDCEEVKRFAGLIQDRRFVSRVLSHTELSFFRKKLCNKDQFLAGRFVAKEAVIKSLSSIVRDLMMNQIFIIDRRGRSPQVVINNPIFAGEKNICIELSISHCNSIAMAFCTAFRKG